MHIDLVGPFRGYCEKIHPSRITLLISLNPWNIRGIMNASRGMVMHKKAHVKGECCKIILTKDKAILA